MISELNKRLGPEWAGNPSEKTEKNIYMKFYPLDGI
jgi:hypothetical protein